MLSCSILVMLLYNILINQDKYPGIYNECFCLGCSKYNVNDNDNDNDNEYDNVKDNDNANAKVNDNDNINDNDDDSDNINDNDDDNDNCMYLFDEKHQSDKPNNKECLSNNISVYISEDLQSWLNDDNIITEATPSENFRSIISGPSECVKTSL